MTREAGLARRTVIEDAVRLVDADGLEQLSLARLAERPDVKVPRSITMLSACPVSGML